MKLRRMRLRLRRQIRSGQQQVEDLGTQAEQNLDRHLLRRFENLKPVRRFVIGWLGLMVLLIAVVVAQNSSLSGYYQTLRPVPGGIYNEGVKGRFTNADPLFATSDADLTVSRLVFAGLLTYDKQGRLAGELAKDYSVDEHGSTYTVHLKPHLTWQDGRPLTSADVVFTYHLIQNPDVRSALQASWQGIEVSAPDSQTVVFKLPGVLAAFPYNMTNGIVPEHLLAKIPPTDLRSADFNTVDPVGAGPFSWQALKVNGDGDPAHYQVQIGLTPFAGYALGKPKLQKFDVQVFADKEQMVKAFAARQLTAMVGLSETPKELRAKANVQQRDLALRAATMVFFKTSSGILADSQVRQALVKATNGPQIINSLDYAARRVREPLLPGQVAYDPSLVQPGFDLAGAKALLENDGWKTATKDGLLSKNNQVLNINLTAADTSEYHTVARQLITQWRQVGANLHVQFLNGAEFQSALLNHNYEAVLNGISIGVDPDVFVYWDSSQADIRSAHLNFSEYKNPTADAALEAGRTRLDPLLRTIKYKPFLQAWQQDNPAVGLYQPRLLYMTNGVVSGLTDEPLPTVTDRFINVQNWEIRQAKVTD